MIEASEVRGRVEAFCAAFNAKDARAFAALFSDDAEFVNIVGMWWRGRAAIEEGHARMFATVLARSTLAIDAIETKAISGDVALAVVRWSRGVLPGVDPLTLPPQDGVLTFVLRREADAVRFVSVHNTQTASLPKAAS
jgi:uncharacterized protein (TIGR02246 family)